VIAEVIAELRDAVQVMHKCSARHFDSVPIVEKMGDKTVWEGVIHIFELEGNSQAKRCYAWMFKDDEGKTRFVTVLGIPPVTSAHTALRAAIASGQQK
jgi:hypothetical protein